MKEGILIAAAIVIIFFVSQFIRKKLSPKTNLFISIISFVTLVVFFITTWKNNFTTIQVIVLIAFAIIRSITLFKRYRRLYKAW